MDTKIIKLTAMATMIWYPSTKDRGIKKKEKKKLVVHLFVMKT